MIQSFSDDSLTKCPECGGEIRKIYSAVGVVFKGSGFYKTDSVKKQASTENSTSAPVAPAAPAASVAPAPVKVD